MKNLDIKFTIPKASLLKNSIDSAPLLLLTEQILNSSKLSIDLNSRNLALGGVFYFHQLNKAIGINYIPQAFVDRVIGIDENHPANLAWNAGFMYAANRKLTPLNIKDLDSLSLDYQKDSPKSLKMN